MKHQSSNLMILKTVFAVALLTAGAWAQCESGIQCSFGSRDTSIVGVVEKTCWDAATLDGQTVDVPRNASFIDNDDFAVCAGSIQQGGADIVFVVDQSGSMADQDPGNQAPVAVNNGLDIMHSLDPNSNATVLRFASGISLNGGCADGSENSPPIAPLSANLATLQNWVTNNIPVPGAGCGGVTTDYREALSAADNLVRSGPLENKAIIFITDGAPVPAEDYDDWTGKNGLSPVHSIFINGDPDDGNCFSSGGRLGCLADLTDGSYNPISSVDELQPVIASILNIVLRTFEPTGATLTNTTNNQTSVSAGFFEQDGSSWRVGLDSIIGLVPGESNALSMITNFEDQNGVPLSDTMQFNIRPVLDPISTVTETVISNQKLTCRYNSSLEWQTVGTSGPPLSGYYSNADASAQLQLVTRGAQPNTSTQVPMATLVPVPPTNETDAETGVLSFTSVFSSSDSIRFLNAITLAGEPTAMTQNNNALNPRYYDTLTANWSHPRNQCLTATAGIPYRPAPQQATIEFTDAAGTPIPGNLVGTETEVYAVVRDQVFDPNRSYTVRFWNEPGTGNDADAVTVTGFLTELEPGRYIFTSPIEITTAANTADAVLQTYPGDQIVARFVDPIDRDSATARIGYGTATEQQATINFITEPGGSDVAPGITWDLGRGVAYLRYRDDPVNGLSKRVALTVANTGHGGPVLNDLDTLSMTQVSPGVWEVSIPLSDNPVMTPNNGTLEIYFRGVINAVVRSHSNNVNTEVPDGGIAQTSLTVAYPNTDENITLRDPNSDDSTVDRHTTDVEICVSDQSFSNSRIDTLLLDDIICSGTGDIVRNIQLIQVSADSGLYCGNVTKNEGTTAIDDGTLTCRDGDVVIATYTDPVYQTNSTVSVTLTDPVTTTVSIHLPGDLDTPVTSIDETTQGNTFIVRVVGKDITLGVTDTKTVQLVSSDGDVEQIEVTEVPGKPGVYEGTVTFGFNTSVNSGNGTIEGSLDLNSSDNSTLVTASVDGASTQFTLNASFVPATGATIWDENSDGRADVIIVQFAKPLASLPTQVTNIDWPGNGSEVKLALQSDITFVAGSNNTQVRISLADDPFAFGVTSASTSANDTPSLTLPDGAVFRNQIVTMEDKVGPAVVEAVKQSGRGSDTITQDGRTIYPLKPDTLTITLSEPIQPNYGTTLPIYDSLFRFSSTCGDPNGQDLNAKIEPVLLNTATCQQAKWEPFCRDQVITDPAVTWLFIVSTDDGSISPNKGDCIYMNTTGPYSDLRGNQPGQGGAELQAILSPTIIENSIVFNQVAGQNTLLPTVINSIDPAVLQGLDPSDIQRDPVTGAITGITQRWIPPIGMTPAGTFNMQEYDICTESQGDDLPLIPYDNQCLSTILVTSDHAYNAHIRIYDHLGKFMHESVQKFGTCGELEDTKRRNAQGKVASWLVWNLRDEGGMPVGNGVYIWKVRYTPVDGGGALKPFTGIYKQGVARSNLDNPAECDNVFLVE